MMKLIMTTVLLLGLIVIGVAGIAQARTMARAVNIVSRIADLRQENNLTLCQEVENDVHLGLRKIQHSFVPLMRIGSLVVLAGLTGLIVTCRTKQNGPGDSENRAEDGAVSEAPQG